MVHDAQTCLCPRCRALSDASRNATTPHQRRRADDAGGFELLGRARKAAVMARALGVEVTAADLGRSPSACRSWAASSTRAASSGPGRCRRRRDRRRADDRRIEVAAAACRAQPVHDQRHRRRDPRAAHRARPGRGRRRAPARPEVRYAAERPASTVTTPRSRASPRATVRRASWARSVPRSADGPLWHNLQRTYQSYLTEDHDRCNVACRDDQGAPSQGPTTQGAPSQGPTSQGPTSQGPTS